MANVIFVASGANITWGTQDAGSPYGGGGGVFKSASLKKTGEVIPILTATGVPDGFVIVPGLTEATYSIYAAANVANPNIGDVANIAGANVYVDNATTQWEQKGIKMVDITGKALPD